MNGAGTGTRDMTIRSLKKKPHKIYQIVCHWLISYYIDASHFNFSIQSFKHIGIVLIINEENTILAASFNMILEDE